MDAHGSQTAAGPSGVIWEKIERLLEDASSLLDSDLAFQEFHAEFLGRIVEALQAVSAVIWTTDEHQYPIPAYQIGFDHTPMSRERTLVLQNEQLVKSVFQDGTARLLHPHSATNADGQAENPTEFLLLFCPVCIVHSTAVVIEVILTAQENTAEPHLAVEVLQSFAEIATQFYTRRELRNLQRQAALWKRFDAFARRVHAKLALLPTAFAIVNEGRQVIGCDRVSLAANGGRRCRLLAISSLHTLDRRSNVVRRLEELAAAVLAARKPLSYPEAFDELPASIQTRLRAYLEEAPVSAISIAPLERPADDSSGRHARAVGALIAEQFDEGAHSRIRENLELIRDHCTTALCNAIDSRRAFLPLAVRKAAALFFPSKLPKTVGVMLLLTAGVIGMMTVPTDFDIEAHGELQPLVRRSIFAPSHGIVREVFAKYKQHVRRGERLLVLHNPDLDLALKETAGDLQTARKKLLAAQAARGVGLSDKMGRIRNYQLAAEEAELKQRLKNLGEQIRILEEQRKALTLTSPIDGQVLTWNLSELLANRPVQRGQKVVRVADPAGPWIIELLVPAKNIGHLLAAQETLGPKLKVSFILATDPSVTYEERIDTVDLSTELHENNRPSVLVTVPVSRDKVRVLRPGATVIAKVHCGRRSIGYVWLRELIETLQTRLFF